MNLQELLARPKAYAFQITVMATNLELKPKRNSSDLYLQLTVQDNSCSTQVAIWENVVTLHSTIKPEDILEIQGTVGEFNNAPQLKVSSIRRLQKPTDLSQFVCSYNATDAADYILATIQQMKDPWQGLSLAAFDLPTFGQGETWEKFKSAPAAKTNHQNRRGGLCVHTAGILHNARTLYNAYLPWDSSDSRSVTGITDISTLVNIDRLLFCVLMHDYCKMFDYNWSAGIEWNQETLVSHLYEVPSHVDRINSLCGNPLSYPEVQIVKYTLLAHHGAFSPLKPKSLEDHLLIAADSWDCPQR